MSTPISVTELPARLVQKLSSRPPAWRWQRAQSWAMRTDRCGWKTEDVWTQQAAVVLRPRPWWFRPAQPLATRIAQIRAAEALAHGPRWQTALRQAWLVTGESPRDVAERLQESVEAVDGYERLFLDVLSPVENGGGFGGKMAVRGLRGWKGWAPDGPGNEIGPGLRRA